MSKLRLKPPARALASRGFHRRMGLSLTRELEEALFRHADVLSEGYSRRSGSGRVYFGSTMITIALARLAPYFRGELDAAARDDLLHAVDGSVRIRLRAMRLGCAEVARRVQSRLGTAQVETRMRVTEDQLHIDVDLEVPVSLSSGSERL